MVVWICRRPRESYGFPDRSLELNEDGLLFKKGRSTSFFTFESIRRIQLISDLLHEKSPTSPIVPVLVVTTPDPNRPDNIAYYQQCYIELHT